MSFARRIVIGGVVMLAVASLGAAVSAPVASAACGQEYRGAPAESGVPGGPPLAIGDSVLADAVPELVGYGFEADGMVCRQMSQGIAMLRERGSRLPHLVVLALGANGEVTTTQIESALALLSRRRVLVLVTPHGSVVPSSADVIRSAAAANPDRILLLDWDRLASAHPGWLAPDGVHLGGKKGIEGFAQMIAGVLPADSAAQQEVEDSNSEPGTPETLQAPPEHRHPQHYRARPHPTPTKARASHGSHSHAPATTVSPARPAEVVEPVRSAGGVPWVPVASALGLLLVAAIAMVRRRGRR